MLAKRAFLLAANAISDMANAPLSKVNTTIMNISIEVF
jgi:hypothetical protein